MWTTIYVARTEREGTVVRECLQRAGFLVSVDTTPAEGGCQLRVPAIEAEEAGQVLSGFFGGRAWRRPARNGVGNRHGAP